MTKTFAVNKNNDLYLDVIGNIAIVTGLEAVMQNCVHVVRTVLGEMVLQTDQGIPDFETVWAGCPNYPQYEAAVRRALLNVDGVIEVVSFMMYVDADQVFHYTATIRTQFGSGELNG